MKYSKQTIANYIARVSTEIVFAREKAKSDELHVHISRGNKKIGKVHNFSLAPIVTCPNCKQCKHYCYDIKACNMYPQVIVARAENTVLAKEHREQTFAEIDNYVSKKHVHKFFRWHVSGDILDIDYFSRMVEIAKNHQDWIFWTYTKAYRIVNEYCDKYGKDSIPKNLSIMFSIWYGLPMDNRYNFPTFECILNGMEEPKDVYRCPGNCDICKAGNCGCVRGESAYTCEH